MEKNKIEWNVLFHDFNKDEIVFYNIFNNGKFCDSLDELYNEAPFTIDQWIEKIDNLCRYCFWSKTEYEILVSGLFGEKTEKIDIYTQLKSNMRFLATYIVSVYYKKFLNNKN